jgi:hypothetical protein
MKRTVFLLVIISLLGTSCSFEQKAYSRIESYMRDKIADPNLLVEQKETVWNEDGVCIVDFKLRYQNKYGGYELTDYEYILLKNRRDNSLYETAINLFNKTSVLYRARKYLNDTGNKVSEEELSNIIYMLSYEEARHKVK